MDQAVGRAVGLLEALARAGGPMRLTRLAEEVGLQKSTAHRLLKSWIELGYVVQEPDTGRYAPSLRLWELGAAVAVEHPVKRAAAGFLQTLHRETGETVSLLIRDGDDVLYLEKLFSPRSVRFSTRPGSRVAAPLTAGGKAMLATDPQARAVLDRVATRERLAPDLAATLAELEVIRRRGWSASAASTGVASFGCALPARSGPATAAISVSAPSERLTGGGDDRIVQALLATCAKLAEAVGPV